MKISLAALFLCAAASRVEATPVTLEIVLAGSNQVAGTWTYDHGFDVFLGVCAKIEDCHYLGQASDGPISPASDNPFEQIVFAGFGKDFYFMPTERWIVAFNLVDVDSGRSYHYCVPGVDSGCSAPGRVPEPSAAWLIALGALMLAAGVLGRRAILT